MREHGMTSVGPLYDFHLPVYDDDTSELGGFLDACKAAGFTKPVYFATPMNLSNRDLIGYGSVDSKPFQQKYLQVMRRLWNEVRKHDMPVVFSIADELTNKGLPGVRYGEQLARLCFEELPEICVSSDMNGYREVLAMAPYLNVAAFNNGWDGADHHNKGRRLLNREFLGELKKTGAIPWFVNGGVGRFPFGFFFWKMSEYGVRGKIEWYYRLGNNRPGSVVRTRGATIWPTLDYERSREGVDDLKYVLKLENMIAAAKTRGTKPAQVRRADQGPHQELMAEAGSEHGEAGLRSHRRTRAQASAQDHHLRRYRVPPGDRFRGIRAYRPGGGRLSCQRHRPYFRSGGRRMPPEPGAVRGHRLHYHPQDSARAERRSPAVPPRTRGQGGQGGIPGAPGRPPHAHHHRDRRGPGGGGYPGIPGLCPSDRRQCQGPGGGPPGTRLRSGLGGDGQPPDPHRFAQQGDRRQETGQGPGPGGYRDQLQYDSRRSSTPPSIPAACASARRR